MTPDDVETLLRIVTALGARRIVEVGHGANLRYMKKLSDAGLEVIGVEKNPVHSEKAEREGLETITADAVSEAENIVRAFRPDLVYSVRPPYELALSLLETYATEVPLAIRPLSGEEPELPSPDVSKGRWFLYLPSRQRSASRA